MAARYRWDDFVLDLDAYRLEREGRPLALEPKAFNLLALVVQQPGHLFTKQEIFDAVWPGTAVTDHALTRVVAQLRRVLGDEAKDARYLETVPTRGYRWIRPVKFETLDRLRTLATEAPAVPHERVPAAAPAAPRGPIAVFTALLLATVAVVAGLTWSRFGTNLPIDGARESTAPPNPAVGLRFPVQLTTHTGLEINPALSPAGDSLALASDRSGSFEIYVRSNGPGGSEVAVTADGRENVQPAWSPDGQHLAYHSSARGGIWIVPARGGTPRQVAAQGSSPEWSPDGRQIAYQSGEHPDIAPTGFSSHVGSTLWVVSATGGSPRPLTSAGQPIGGHSTPAWSEDGRYIAFAVFDGGTHDGLWLLDLTSGRVSAVDRSVRVYEPAFAAGGQALLAAAGAPLIYRWAFDPATGRATGERETIVVPGVPGTRGLSVARDGRSVLFAGLGLSSHIWMQRLDTDLRAAGAPFPLTRDTSRRNYAPSVSPDGTKVAYGSARLGELANIWMMDLGSRQAVQLTSNDGFDGNPAWFPDGRRVAFMSDRGGAGGMWAVDVVSKREELMVGVADASAARGAPAPFRRLAELQLSPSAERTAFVMAVPPYGFRQLLVGHLSPQTATPVTDGTISIGYPVWSRDERRLAVEIQEAGFTQLGVLDLDTGRLRRLTSGRVQVWARSWTPGDRRVAAAVLRGRTWSLEWFDPATAESGVLLPPGPSNVYFRYPEVSPKGDFVVFERGQVNGNIWRLTLSHAAR